MVTARKKKRKETIFEGIRKPTAPPSRKIGSDRPKEKTDPTGRTTKHKKRDQDDVDI